MSTADLQTHRTRRLDSIDAPLTIEYGSGVSQRVLEELEDAVNEDAGWFRGLSERNATRWKSPSTNKTYHLQRHGNYGLIAE